MQTQLPFHEWSIILLFCTILILLAGFALGRQKPIPTMQNVSSKEEAMILKVKIEGQVAKPGFYRLPYRSSLKELLELAQPLPSADLSLLKGRQRLRDGQVIVVPERHWMTIQIKGAVEQSGPLKILSGTRCYELVEQVKLLPDADLKSLLKKKHFLQEGEVIEISTKQSKSKKCKPINTHVINEKMNFSTS